MKPEFSHKQAGFTMVEVMIAIVVASILCLVIGILSVASNSYFISDSQKIRLQQDLSLAISIFTREIHQAVMLSSGIFQDSSTVLTGPSVNNGECLRLIDHNGNEKWLFKSGNDLVVRHNNGSKQRIIQDKIISLQFVQRGRSFSDHYIDVSLELSENDESISAEHTIGFRN